MDTSKVIDLLGISTFKEKIISLIPTKISQLENDSNYIESEFTTVQDMVNFLNNETTI